ncbi:sulfotransferase [Rhodoferax ferrireducens]|uniref:sulfotransferase n=1 Tax=Rhodoferax ferrireducens TaxID=192843 RepID=UPI0002E17B14|nr:sulfotransferase [Rhodoferax ferrireducens]
MKIIDLSGYMFSGKSAVSDILREFDGIQVPNYRVEFDLLRMPGGMIDLKHAVMDWSPVRTYGAVRRFDKLVNMLALSPRFPGKLYKTGFGYTQHYPNILRLKDEFLRSIIAVQWDTPWPYADIDDGPIDTFVRKICSKLSISKSRKYFLVDKEKFIPASQKFIQGLLINSIANDQPSVVVTHNALEPFLPGRNLDLLGDDAVCIVVDRDPRDIYATAITSQVGFNDNLRFYRRIAGAHDVEVFIKRYLIYRKNINFDDRRVLRLNFRDLVLDYNQSLQEICDFSGLELTQQIRKRQFFNPDNSRNNIDIWKQASLNSYSEDFSRIETECHA